MSYIECSETYYCDCPNNACDTETGNVEEFCKRHLHCGNCGSKKIVTQKFDSIDEMWRNTGICSNSACIEFET